MLGDGFERLTTLDRSFLVYEDTSPNAHMHVAAVQIYDLDPLGTGGGGLDVDRLREYVASRLHWIPRFRQRLAYTPVTRTPVWVDDPRFNLHYHVRHTRLPRPGSERLLKRVVGRIVSQRLDRGKPLWEMWFIEGLEGRRFALVHKIHHCMIDGVSGVDLMTVLMSAEPGERVDAPPLWVPREVPSATDLLAGEIWSRARVPFDLATAALRVARNTDHTRHHLAERLRAAGRAASSGLRSASPTPLNRSVGAYRRFDWLSTDLAAVRAVRRALGGSVNDVVLAAATGAVRRFLGEFRGVDLRGIDFRAMVPVSVRTDDQRGALGNRVSAWVVPLPVGEPDPVRRLEAICRTTEELKRSNQALGAEVLTQVPEFLGTTLLSLGARLMAWGLPFNVVVTNVPGPRAPFYLLGSRMREAFPVVPLMGHLTSGFALFGYAGRLHWGLVADWDHVPDLHDLTLSLESSFGDLCAAAAARDAPPLAAAGHLEASA